MADCAFYGGIPNDKLTQAQNANKDMITTLLGFGSTRIGLIAYKNIVFSAGSIGLTNNVDVLNTTINSWQSADTTCICCGINNASWNFARQSSGEKLKSLIVMSDGEANINCSGGGNSGGSGKSDSIKAACAANSTLNNLVIYSIGVEGADEATLTAIATCGGGKYFPVANASELISTYQAIAEQIQEKFETITAIAYLYVVFYNETDDTYRERIVDVPGVLETKTYNFNLLGRLTGKIVRIEIYPVVVTPSKEEIVGPLLDSWILGGYN